MKQLRIDVWSDIACPWCFVGKRRLEAALQRFPQRDAVQVVWRAFELDPRAPRIKNPAIPYAERLASKYGTSMERAEEMIHTMTATAAGDGLDFHFERIRPGNTFDAHRVLHYAAECGQADAAKERLLQAYMTEGEPIGDCETLVRLASEVGLDTEEVRRICAGDAYSAAVRADEEEAHARGIAGVPHFLIGGRFALSGAQLADSLLSAMNRAWEELGEADPGDAATGGVACRPDGCD